MQTAADAEPARQACITYERPELEVFGSLHDLTRGPGGNAADMLFGSLVQ